MKNFFAVIALLTSAVPHAFGHGIGGHVLRAEEEHDHSRHAHSHEASDGKSLKELVVSEGRPWWGASLETGWTSREVHYGIDETGNYGAYTTELNLRLGNLTLGVWSGFGTGNDFQEWDFTAAYNLEFGDVFLIPGYNFRYRPGTAENHSGHDHEDDDHDEHGHEGHVHDAGHHSEPGGRAGHAHKTYGHEVFFLLGTTAIPYVTPSMSFVWDLSNTPGVYLDFRLDGEIPVYKDIITLNPYALLSLNLGYNTREYYGWNNFQFGLEGAWRLNRIMSLVGGVNYSVAMTALQKIGQDNVVWANAGVRFEF